MRNGVLALADPVEIGKLGESECEAKGGVQEQGGKLSVLVHKG